MLASDICAMDETAWWQSRESNFGLDATLHGEPQTIRFDFNRSTAWRFLVLSATLCALLHVASSCAFSSRVQTPRSSWEQILATTAIDRALQQVEWP